jgi:branched-subunit amino acid ABC-type transport system permease component
MFESLLILAVVAIGGASVCSGALAGGLAIGFLPGNAQDVFIGAGTVALAFSPDGVLLLAYARFHQWWANVTAPLRSAPQAAPAPVEERPGKLAGTRAA